MAQYFTNFSEYTAGSGTPSGWTRRWVTSNVTDSILADGGYTGGKALQIEQSGNARRLITWDDIPDDDNVEIVFRWKRLDGIATNSNVIGPAGRASGSASSETAYTAMTVVVASNNEHFALRRYLSGVFSSALDAETAATPAIDTWHYQRLRLNGTSLQGWYWTDPDEQGDGWALSATDGNITADGWVGILTFGSSSSGTTRYIIDWIGVGTDGDPAPIEPPPQEVSAAHLPITATLHAATVEAGEATSSAAHLTSSLQLHNATLTAGEATVSAAHLDSGLQLHNATLTAGAATLDAAYLDSTLSLESATITTTVTLDAAHLDSTLVLHDGTAFADGAVSALHLDSALTLYNATVIFDQSLEAAHLDNTVTLYDGQVSNDEGIAAQHLASTLELHLATLTPGAAEIAAALLDNEVALYGAGVLPGAATLDAAHLALTGQLHDAQVVPGAATADALHLASLLQVYPATLGFDQTLAAALLDASVVLYPGTFLRPVPSRARLRDRTTYYRLADRTDEYRLDDRTTRYRLRKE